MPPRETCCELLSNLYLCIGNNNTGDDTFTKHGLWIAFKFVSLHWQQQPAIELQILISVVNCFQICIFALATTTQTCRRTWSCRLWIAFKFVSLHWQQQPFFCIYFCACCCELLSNLYLCIGNNNERMRRRRPRPLWIAFKFVSLHWQQQQNRKKQPQKSSCELLSNLYLCIGNNNPCPAGQ